MKTGLFTGSFDPFTIGHQSIVARVLPLFDKLVIGVGVNERKKYMYSVEVRVKVIAELYADNPKVEVRAFNDLAVDFAHREGGWFFVKGVRSVKDFEYEREPRDGRHRNSPSICRTATRKRQLIARKGADPLRQKCRDVPPKESEVSPEAENNL